MSGVVQRPDSRCGSSISHTGGLAFLRLGAHGPPSGWDSSPLLLQEAWIAYLAS